MIVRFAALMCAPALADPDAPLRVAVSCPAQGICRIPIPPSMVAVGEGIALQDRSGEAVPFARVSAAQAPNRWLKRSISRGDDPSLLSFRAEEAVVSVRLQQDADDITGLTRYTPAQQWAPGRSSEGTVVPIADPEALQIGLQSTGIWSRKVDLEVGVMGPPRSIPATLEAHGEGVVSLSFARLLPLSRLELDTLGEGSIRLFTWQADEAGRLAPTEVGTVTVQQAGDGHARAVLEGQPIRRLGMLLPEGMSIEGGRGWAPRELLLVRDGGEMTLYGGLGDGSLPALQMSLQTLLDLPWTGATLKRLEDNPSHADPLAPLWAPGAVFAPQRMVFTRTVRGGGTRRLVIPPAVRAWGGGELEAVRILDDEDRQIPYIIQEEFGWEMIPDVAQDVEERGAETRITMTLPTDGIDDVRLQLETPTTGIGRQISVETAGGRVLRRSDWSGGVGRWMLPDDLPDVIVIRVFHGDNAPVVVEGGLWLHRVSVLARLPTSARLVYGDRSRLRDERGPLLGRKKRQRSPRLREPDYDLRRNAAAAALRVTGMATVGPEQRVLGEDEADRPWALFVTALAALGLIAVLGRSLAAGVKEAGESASQESQR
ncbi:MAG: hypothetical protein AAFV53_14685 [Myxococcota bacterium]